MGVYVCEWGCMYLSGGVYRTYMCVGFYILYVYGCMILCGDVCMHVCGDVCMCV